MSLSLLNVCDIFTKEELLWTAKAWVEHRFCAKWQFPFPQTLYPGVYKCLWWWSRVRIESGPQWERRGSLRLEWRCEVWVRWELNCTACLCQFVKALAGCEQEAKWGLTAAGLQAQTRVHSGVPALSKPLTAAVNLHLPLVTADCGWSVRPSRCKDFSSWHLVWLLSNLSSVCSCQHPQWTARSRSGLTYSALRSYNKTWWRFFSQDFCSVSPSNLWFYCTWGSRLENEILPSPFISLGYNPANHSYGVKMALVCII